LSTPANDAVDLTENTQPDYMRSYIKFKKPADLLHYK